MLTARAILLESTQRFGQALHDYRVACELAPHPSLYTNMGFICLGMQPCATRLDVGQGQTAPSPSIHS